MNDVGTEALLYSLERTSTWLDAAKVFLAAISGRWVDAALNGDEDVTLVALPGVGRGRSPGAPCLEILCLWSDGCTSSS